MISMDCPDLEAREVFTQSISRVRNPDLRSRLIAITDNVSAAAVEFIDKAKNNTLYEFPREAIVGGVTTVEMEKVYTQRMAGKKGPGRPYYDTIFNSSAKCLLCIHRTVDTLDHHLPKAHYPILAVTPANLIPACSTCNKAKLATIPTDLKDSALHPYFDCIESERWLYGCVVPGSPAVVTFKTLPHGDWPEELGTRVENHFKGLGLGSLYSAEATDELSAIRHQLKGIYAQEGCAGIKSEMQQRYDSASAARLNGWRAATYEAFLESDWFCEGGFALE